MQPRGQAEQEFALGEEVYLSGGTFVMGSDTHYPEERPAHPVSVGDFWIDVTPVTNRQFAAFVAATGYLTVAERAPDPKDYPCALPHMLRPGIGLRIHGHGGDAHAAGGADDAAGDLAAVGYEDFREHFFATDLRGLRGSGRGVYEKTRRRNSGRGPKFRRSPTRSPVALR